MATSSRRRCLNEPNVFCYICGEHTLQHNKKTISDFVKLAYLAYFKVMVVDQNKPWAPHIVCKPCVEHLRQWTNKSRESLRFAIPMVWREPKDPCNDCYFCAVKTKGINRKNRNSLTYPNLNTAIRPVPHSEELPVPVSEGLPQLESSLSSEEEDISIDSDKTLADNDFPPSLLSSQLFSQGELNDLARDLNLSMESSELLASRVKEKNLLKRVLSSPFTGNVIKNSFHISPKKMRLCTVTTLKVFWKSSECLNIILTIGNFSLKVVKEVCIVFFCIMVTLLDLFLLGI